MLALGVERTKVGPAQRWVHTAGGLEACGLWGLGEMLVLSEPGQSTVTWVPRWPQQPQGPPLSFRR